MKYLLLLLAVCSFVNVAPRAMAEGEGVKIKRQYVAGRTYVMEQEIEQSSKTKVAGRDFDMSSKVRTGITMTVTKGEKEGQKKVKMTYDRMSMTMKAAGQDSGFDSEKPDEGDSDPLSKVGRMIVGKSLDLLLSEKNEVLEVEGLEELAEEMGPLKQMFSKETLTQMMQMADMQAPDRLLKPGEMWPLELSIAIPSIGRMTMRGDVTYEKNTEVDGVGCAFLEYGGVLKLAAEQKKEGQEDGDSGEEEEDPAMKLMKELDMKMSGNFEGTISFDTALGMERRMAMTMSLNMTMKNPADPEARMAIPMKQKFTQTLKSVK